MKVGDLVKCLNTERADYGNVGLVMEHEVYYGAANLDGEEGYWVAYNGRDDWRWQLTDWIEVINESR